MKILKTVEEMRAACRDAKRVGKRLGFVPTMGALHEGHLSLVRAARKQCDAVAVSIFVNPAQFGPNEDWNQYPRPFERDCALLNAESVDLLFSPAPEVMYPPGACTYVTVEGMSERLCGRSRPGHFRGVTTVVSKLFHIVEPDLAYFGQKDAAQVSIIRRMVRDLDMSSQIVVSPIVREPDGLAMSSRNIYLNPAERQQATALYRSLQCVQALYEKGERRTAKLLDAAQRIFLEEMDVKVDYVEAVHNDTLEPVGEEVSSGTLVAVAARVGGTRLIDNIIL